MSQSPGLSVIVPVFNSEETLPLLVRSLNGVLRALTANYEILLVNDGSRDQSWNCIEKLAQEYSNVSGICLMRNYGQHNALLCGVRNASFEICITIDDDLQNDPRDIPLLLSKLGEGYDVIYGIAHTLKHDPLRNLASTLTKLILEKTMGARSALQISQFRAFRTCIRDSFINYSNPFICLDVLLSWGADKFGAVSVEHKPRLQGESNYSFARLVQHALNMFTGFSTLPLRIASFNGFLCLVFGFCALLYVFVNYAVNGGAVPGFAFISSLIIIFSGAQLLALGVIGEYLARIYAGMMHKPPYVVYSQTKTLPTPQRQNLIPATLSTKQMEQFYLSSSSAVISEHSSSHVPMSP